MGVGRPPLFSSYRAATVRQYTLIPAPPPLPTTSPTSQAPDERRHLNFVPINSPAAATHFHRLMTRVGLKVKHAINL